MDADNADNASHRSAQAVVVGVKSWLAYAGTFLLAAILAGITLLAGLYLADDRITGTVMMVSAVIVGYKFLSVRSVLLYYDEVGVWVYSGILPWKKGVTGVKWRDMDEATFAPGFWSWVSRSYTVRIGHRYTKGSEIALTNIANGKDTVAKLNAKHQALLQSDAID